MPSGTATSVASRKPVNDGLQAREDLVEVGRLAGVAAQLDLAGLDLRRARGVARRPGARRTAAALPARPCAPATESSPARHTALARECRRGWCRRGAASCAQTSRKSAIAEQRDAELAPEFRQLFARLLAAPRCRSSGTSQPSPSSVELRGGLSSAAGARSLRAALPRRRHGVDRCADVRGSRRHAIVVPAVVASAALPDARRPRLLLALQADRRLSM